MSPVHRCTHTHRDRVVVSSLVLQSRSTARSARSFWHNYCTFAAVLEPFSTCLISLLVNRLLDAPYVYVMKLRDIWSISVLYRRCGCALVCLPNVKPVLLQYLELGVFIWYWAVQSDCVIVFVEFVWQFCSKKEYRLIFGKVLYSTVTKLHFKQLIQTTKHKGLFRVHFFKFLVTAIYQSESRTASRSPWHIIRQSLFLSAWDPFVICQPFNIIFSSHSLCLMAAISIQNYPTICTLRPKSV